VIEKGIEETGIGKERKKMRGNGPENGPRNRGVKVK
jgi:hypothetical protein